MRSATQPCCNTVEYGCVSLRMRFVSQNFGTIKRILPESSSSSHREGPGIEAEPNTEGGVAGAVSPPPEKIKLAIFYFTLNK